MTHLSRRAFLERTALLAGAAPFAWRVPTWPGSFAHGGPSLRIGVVNDPTAPNDPRGMGITLGVEEAQHAAALFGGSLTVVPLRDDASLAGLSAVVGDHDCARTRQIGDRADAAAIPFFNVGCSDDALRGASCRRTMFHVAPSDAMCRDARAGARASASATVAAWLPTLHRFGADTLNGRFAARFQTPMSADAWTAWLAMKILWESALRAASAEPAKLIAFLGHDATQFDGHKGLPLSFRSWDRQLRQPLYVVDGAKITELPAANPNDSARDLLDRYGTPSASSACPPAS